MKITREQVLELLNQQLDLGKEVGIFKVMGEDENENRIAIYDVITDGNGQHPILSGIPQEVFLDIYHDGYLLFPACTKVGSHWYYDFNTRTRNGFSLHQFYKLEDFPFLQDKKFRIVPRGKKSIFHVRDREFTKIRDHASLYTLEDLFRVYTRGSNPFCTWHYSTYHVNVGSWGAQREYTKLYADIDVELQNGEVVEYENYAKEFDLISEDEIQRFHINKLFREKTDSLGEVGKEQINLYPGNSRKEREQKLIDNPNNFKVTFSIGTRGGSMWSLGSSYYKATYLQRVTKDLPFEEIKTEEKP